jgi:hypothetical protein
MKRRIATLKIVAFDIELSVPETLLPAQHNLSGVDGPREIENIYGSYKRFTAWLCHLPDGKSL